MQQRRSRGAIDQRRKRRPAARSRKPSLNLKVVGSIPTRPTLVAAHDAVCAAPLSPSRACACFRLRMSLQCPNDVSRLRQKGDRDRDPDT
jgi:hypothetical protein